MEISLVIPCYREGENIARIVAAVSRTLADLTYEIILVDDGSDDDTLVRMKAVAGADSRVRYLSFSRNFGHQAALLAGIVEARGDCVISMDADLEHPVDLLPKMIELWRQGHEVVLTRRRDKQQLPWTKRQTSKFFYQFLNFITDVDIAKGSADFRLLDRKVVNICRNLSEVDIFWRGMIPWLGFKQVVIDYDQGQRTHGETSYTFKKMVGLAVAGITGFSTKPLLLSAAIGLFFATLSFLYGIYSLVVFFFTDGAISGWTSTIASILFMVGAVDDAWSYWGLFRESPSAKPKAAPVHHQIQGGEGLNQEKF